MPEGEVPVALLTFNLGVEAGQLAIVVVALAVLVLIARVSAPALAMFLRAAAYPIGSIAAFFGMSNRFANMTSLRPNDEFYLMGRVAKEAKGETRLA